MGLLLAVIVVMETLSYLYLLAGREAAMSTAENHRFNTHCPYA